jgi:hypothetical protein
VIRLVRGLLPRRGRPRALLLLAGLVLLAGLLAIRLLPGPGPRCQQIGIPAYFYPGASWARAVSSSPAPGIMILDVTSSGAGSAPDRTYQQAVSRAQAAGITILGYANTDYARRPAAAVEADVRHYRAWYHVAGMFLDEAATGGPELGYYRRLTGYIKNAGPGALVMLNPGTYPSQRYMSLGDVVLGYEGSYARYARLRVPGWVRRYPAARFAQVVYATPGARLAKALRLAAARHAGYVYVTDMAGRNPYRALPGYWAAENAMVAAACPALSGKLLRILCHRHRAFLRKVFFSASVMSRAVTMNANCTDLPGGRTRQPGSVGGEYQRGSDPGPGTAVGQECGQPPQGVQRPVGERSAEGDPVVSEVRSLTP